MNVDDLHDLLKEHTDQDKDQFEALHKQLEQCIAKLNKVESLLQRYQGFVGGAVFVVGAIWAVLELISGKLINSIFGGH